MPISYPCPSDSSSASEEARGLQEDLKNPEPVATHIPSEIGNYRTYKAAGNFWGKGHHKKW
ncbi:hypothetical protein BDV26DRAFT_265386 [Aspergillus bertholletiae]|uniref:Uncharacterized protein n=1 Tax=Aspergillus bertholletiae TaxID=1226010 RepID=A0A5N7B310_9EURO|nr:hypothetical protein BDV26DRAFT_265386 [Aspergillus bertholletiae]